MPPYPVLTLLLMGVFGLVGWLWRMVRQHPQRVAVVLGAWAAASVIGWSALVQTGAGVVSAAGLVALVWWRVGRVSFTAGWWSRCGSGGCAGSSTAGTGWR